MDIVSVCKLAGLADDGDDADKKSVCGDDGGGGDGNIGPNAKVPSVSNDAEDGDGDTAMAANQGTDPPPEGLVDHKLLDCVLNIVLGFSPRHSRKCSEQSRRRQRSRFEYHNLISLDMDWI